MTLAAPKRAKAEKQAYSGLPRDVFYAGLITTFLLVLVSGLISSKLALIIGLSVGMSSLCLWGLTQEMSITLPRKTVKKPVNAAVKKPAPANTNRAGVMKDSDVKETLRKAIAENNVHLFTQPIVSLPQRHVKFQEVFGRIELQDNSFMPAAAYLDMARKAGMMADLDTASVAHSLAMAAQAVREGKYNSFFINISSAALKRGAFMQRLLRVIGENKDIAPSLVFEMHQSDFDALDNETYKVLEGMSEMGCRLSIDNITHFKFDIEAMRALNVRFVKLDARVLVAKTKDQLGRADIEQMKRLLESNDINPIIEKIESEYAVKELLDFDFKYGQGYLFSKPRLHLNSQKVA